MKGQRELANNSGSSILDQMLTVDRLRQILDEYFNRFSETLKQSIQPPPLQQSKVYLRSKEVCELLKISSTTLFNLRQSRRIAFTKIDGVYFYDRADIDRMLEQSRVEPSADQGA